MKFNATRLYNNVKALAKTKGVKIGTIEEAAGVSPGYLSRLAAKDEDKVSSALLDFIISASDSLSVSIDILLSVDITYRGPNGEKVTAFLMKLITRTNEGFIEWKSESPESYNSIQVLSSGITRHPLFVSSSSFTDEEHPPKALFDSKFRQDARINGVCYKAEINHGATVYLMKTSVSSPIKMDFIKREAFEVYIYFQNNVEPLCECDEDSPDVELFTILEGLYTAAEESMKSIRLGHNSENIIDDFMDL